MLTVSFFTKFSTKKTKRDVNNSLKKYSSRVLVECSTIVISTIQKVTDKLKKSIFFPIIESNIIIIEQKKVEHPNVSLLPVETVFFIRSIYQDTFGFQRQLQDI
jgi:hypothetical protein